MTLKTKADGHGDAQAAQPAGGASSIASAAPTAQDSLPILGLFAVGFGLLGIFSFAPVFVPLALIFGLIALFVGQIIWGLTAVLLAVVGFVTSPIFMTLLGLGAAAAWFSNLF